ncbi:hypothetical protein ACKX2L_06910 [Lachnospiraceae bacterium YH-ros2228]
MAEKKKSYDLRFLNFRDDTSEEIEKIERHLLQEMQQVPFSVVGY